MNTKYIALTVLATAVVSCSAPRNVPYFQDAEGGAHLEVAAEKRITLQPDDKVSIIVKSKDIELSNLFNLPYYSQRLGTSLEQSRGYSMGIASYLIDEEGNLDFPVLGAVHAAGLTRSELAETIKSELIGRSLVGDPVVTVDFINLNVSVLGDVARPGRFEIDHDVYTIHDAISAAGDLNITGTRTNVKVIRTENGQKKIYTVNLNSAREAMSSPAYYLRQNDVVYVEPNKMKTRQSTVNGNNVLSTSFWLSMASLAVTILLAVKQL